MRYLRAPWRVVQTILGLNFEPVEPIDYTEAAQLSRVAQQLEREGKRIT